MLTHIRIYSNYKYNTKPIYFFCLIVVLYENVLKKNKPKKQAKKNNMDLVLYPCKARVKHWLTEQHKNK